MPKTYEILRGRYLRRMNGERIMLRPGDEFVPTSNEIKNLGDQIAPVKAMKRAAPPQPKEEKVEEKQAPTPAEVPDTGEAEEPSFVELGGGWYQLADGTKVHGKAQLEEALSDGQGDSD